MNKTKTIVIGKNHSREIVFFKSLQVDTYFNTTYDLPSVYKYIELVCLNYGSDQGQYFDLMFAYNDPQRRGEGVLYIGKWNDGVVK